MTHRDDWYKIKKEDILQEKVRSNQSLICLYGFNLVQDGGSVLNHYGGSFVKAIMSVFPEYGLTEVNFHHMPCIN